MRDEGKEDGAAPEQERAVKLEVLVNPGGAVGGGLYQTRDPEDTTAKSPDPEKRFNQVHLITEVTDFLVYVKGLRSHYNRQMVMTLELEEITDSGIKIFEASVVPNHADLINDDQTFRRECFVAYVLVADPLGTQYLLGAEDVPALLPVPGGVLGQQRRLPTPLLPEDENQLVWIEITPGEKVPDKHGGQQDKGDLKNNHRLPPKTETHQRTDTLKRDTEEPNTPDREKD